MRRHPLTVREPGAEHEIRHYTHDILWGQRLADVLREVDGEHLVLDLNKFHNLVPTNPTPDFPYP
jgi:hypothetical protein